MSIINVIKRIFDNIFKRGYGHTGKKYGQLEFIFKEGYGLSAWAEKKAVRKHNKLVNQFIRRNKRCPTRFEIGRIIINASHITIRYRRGRSGHWGRQKVRQYLFNLYGIKYNKR